MGFLFSLLGIFGNVSNHSLIYMPLESHPSFMEIKQYQAEVASRFFSGETSNGCLVPRAEKVPGILQGSMGK